MSQQKIKIRQIYYDKSQEPLLDKGFIPYYNTECTPFMENDVISQLYTNGDHIDCDYYGVFSWKFFEKSNLTYANISSKLKDDNYNANVYVFNGNTKLAQIYKRDAASHGHVFPKVAELIFDKLGYKNILSLYSPYVYCNSWLAKRSIFEKYCNEILLPCMDIMKTDNEIIGLLMSDSRYTNPYKITMEQKKYISKIFGVPYYTLHPFICERFFSIFLGLNHISYNAK